MNWKDLLCVAVGGAVGSSLRYCISALFVWRGLVNFPYATLVVNGVGCFLIGALAPLAVSGEHRLARLLLVVGVLGGFTTFSSFSLDTWLLAKDGHYSLAALNVFLQLSVGAIGLLSGLALVRSL